MKHLNFLFFILFIANGLQAQVVRLDFPYFAGKEYVCALIQGDKNDTIQTGSLDDKGQAVLTVPKNYSTYRGMLIFRLLEGGGLDIILNDEKAFLIRCTEAQPNKNNIFFIGSPENNYINQNSQRQDDLLNKWEVSQAVLAAYSPKDSLYVAFEREKNRLETAYADLQTETAKSPLLAARIKEIHNFLQGFGSRMYPTEEENRNDLLDFVTKRLDIKILYTSNLWDSTIRQWTDILLS